MKKTLAIFIFCACLFAIPFSTIFSSGCDKECPLKEKAKRTDCEKDSECQKKKDTSKRSDLEKEEKNKKSDDKATREMWESIIERSGSY